MDLKFLFFILFAIIICIEARPQEANELEHTTQSGLTCAYKPRKYPKLKKKYMSAFNQFANPIDKPETRFKKLTKQLAEKVKAEEQNFAGENSILTEEDINEVLEFTRQSIFDEIGDWCDGAAKTVGNAFDDAIDAVAWEIEKGKNTIEKAAKDVANVAEDCYDTVTGVGIDIGKGAESAYITVTGVGIDIGKGAEGAYIAVTGATVDAVNGVSKAIDDCGNYLGNELPKVLEDFFKELPYLVLKHGRDVEHVLKSFSNCSDQFIPRLKSIPDLIINEIEECTGKENFTYVKHYFQELIVSVKNAKQTFQNFHKAALNCTESNEDASRSVDCVMDQFDLLVANVIGETNRQMKKTFDNAELHKYFDAIIDCINFKNIVDKFIQFGNDFKVCMEDEISQPGKRKF